MGQESELLVTTTTPTPPQAELLPLSDLEQANYLSQRDYLLLALSGPMGRVRPQTTKADVFRRISIPTHPSNTPLVAAYNELQWDRRKGVDRHELRSQFFHHVAQNQGLQQSPNFYALPQVVDQMQRTPMPNERNDRLSLRDWLRKGQSNIFVRPVVNIGTADKPTYVQPDLVAQPSINALGAPWARATRVLLLHPVSIESYRALNSESISKILADKLFLAGAIMQEQDFIQGIYSVNDAFQFPKDKVPTSAQNLPLPVVDVAILVYTQRVNNGKPEYAAKIFRPTLLNTDSIWRKFMAAQQATTYYSSLLTFTAATAPN